MSNCSIILIIDYFVNRLIEYNRLIVAALILNISDFNLKQDNMTSPGMVKIGGIMRPVEHSTRLCDRLTH